MIKSIVNEQKIVQLCIVYLMFIDLLKTSCILKVHYCSCFNIVYFSGTETTFCFNYARYAY